MPDPTINIALHLAELIGPPPTWDASVEECVRLAQLANIHALGARNQTSANMLEFFIDVHRVFFDWSSKPESVPNVAAHYERMNILLRLWAGCVSAGKMIALRTNDGLTSTDQRAASFAGIDALANSCPICRLGVEAGYPWKVSLGQGHEVSFDGVPADSPARMHYKP